MRKTNFLLFHLIFLLSLIAVYHIPLVCFWAQDLHQPPMNRYVRFYILGVLGLVYIFNYLFLYHYNKTDVLLFEFNRMAIYFWVSTLAVLLFLCTSYAIFSSDLFEYSMRARMFAIYKLNPYIHTPIEVSKDIFFPLIFWKQGQGAQEGYGPLWVMIGSIHTLFFRNSAFWTSYMHKLIVSLFYFGSIPFFHRLCLHLKIRKPDVITVAFFTNPLVVISTFIDGHNDISMLFFAFMALYFVLRARYIVAFMLFALAVQIKFLHILLFPILFTYVFIKEGDWTAKRKVFLMIKGSLISIATVALTWLPFLKEDTFAALFNYYFVIGKTLWYDSVPYVFYFVFTKFGILISKEVICAVFTALFLGIYFYLFYYFMPKLKKDDRMLFSFFSFVYIAMFLTNPTSYQSWYIMWFLPFLLLSRIRFRFLLFYLLSFFSLITFWKRMSAILALFIVVYVTLMFLYKRNKLPDFFLALEEQK